MVLGNIKKEKSCLLAPISQWTEHIHKTEYNSEDWRTEDMKKGTEKQDTIRRKSELEDRNIGKENFRDDVNTKQGNLSHS